MGEQLMGLGRADAAVDQLTDEFGRRDISARRGKGDLVRLALAQADLPAANVFEIPVLTGQRLEETDVLELLDSGLEFFFDLGGVMGVVATEAHAIKCDLGEVEHPVRVLVEPFVEEAIEPLGGRMLERKIHADVEQLEVVGLATVEEDSVPGEAGERK